MKQHRCTDYDFPAPDGSSLLVAEDPSFFLLCSCGRV